MYSWTILSRCLLVTAAFTVFLWPVDTALDESHASPSQLFFASQNVAPNNEATYLPHSLTQGHNLQRIIWPSTPAQDPDTTIVLLNWSRLKNVIFQASVYCGPLLRGVVEQVFVWNNQPNITLEYEKESFNSTHFADTGCSPERLHIYNSPSNLYFQARFAGCAESRSRYCFLQDDDYLTPPEILLNIHASFENSEQLLEVPSPIILLPPKDHLETDFLKVSVPSKGGILCTSFAWLGYGTYLLRSQAQDYLALLRRLDLSEEEMNMADNYFTLLRGQTPKTWFTHIVELNHEFAFTVGLAGVERNWNHTERAMIYLDEIVHLEKSEMFPHFSPSQSSRQHGAPCIAHPCTVLSNIPILPPLFTLNRTWSHKDHMREIQARRFAELGKGAQWYINYPLSRAVDSDVTTAFRSAGTAKAGDYFHLRLLPYELNSQAPLDNARVDLAWLVDASTASILHLSNKEISPDGIHWSPLATTPFTCFSTTLPLPPDFPVGPRSVLGLFGNFALQLNPASDRTTVLSAGLLECHTTLESAIFQDLPLHLRVILSQDLSYGWSIYEVWFRAH